MRISFRRKAYGAAGGVASQYIWGEYGGEHVIQMRPYKPGDAKIIATWLGDERAFRLWSADQYEHFPIAPEDMNAYYDRSRDDGNIWGMTAFDGSSVLGHMTMRFPDAHRRVLRFGFVIVDPARRGHGCGREMLRMAIQYAFLFTRAEKISLGVFAQNEAAIRCYRACGFERPASGESRQYMLMGEIWNCIEMELPKARLQSGAL